MKFRAKINGEWTDWVDKETLRKMNISAFTWIQGEGSQESNTAGNTPALADFWTAPVRLSSPKPAPKSRKWIWISFLSFFFLLFVVVLWQSARSDAPVTREDKIEFYRKTLEQIQMSYSSEDWEETRKSIRLAQSLEKDLEFPMAIELEQIRAYAIEQGDSYLESELPEQALPHYEMAQVIQNDRLVRRKIRKTKAMIP